MKLIENLEMTNQMWFEKKESLTESPSQPSLQAQGEQGQRTGCFCNEVKNKEWKMFVNSERENWEKDWNENL